MLRLTSNIGRLSLSSEAFTTNFNNLQSVRWRRKPRWLPTAKSKVFKVPKRPEVPEEEKLELMKLYNNYRTQIKSLRKYFDRKYNIRYQQSTDIEQHMKDFEQDFARCTALNDTWNAERQKVREKRLAETIKQEVEIAEQRLLNRTLIWEKEREEAEMIVRREKEAAKTFITPENLDQAIEYAITNPVDHNFSIDLEGNRYVGRETKPENQAEETKAAVKQ